MEEDFSLSVNGAEIQKKMPFSSPSYIGISQLSTNFLETRIKAP